jgi:hypothetical protein
MEHCVRDAIFHLDCAKQALEASLTDPEGWKQDSVDHTRVITKLFPLMVALSLALPRTRTHSSPESVENSQEPHEESP